ncbi:MAG TPA: hypothetical protein VKD90_19975 [Gemmataceae bacterium]|nr:hypothetical protein [Gemmataceae bacterium]
MHTSRRAKLLTLAALGLTAGLSTGCQTWVAGMTLPSPHYLDSGHVPQYFPAEPDFPLTRELSYQEEAAGLLNPRDRAPVRGAPPVPGVAAPPAPGVAPGGGAAAGLPPRPEGQ